MVVRRFSASSPPPAPLSLTPPRSAGASSMPLLLPAALLVPCSLSPFQDPGPSGPLDRNDATVIAVESGDVHDLWSVSHRTWETELVATGVSFRSVSLVGYGRKDALRLDLPRPGETGDELPDHVLLPGGGALYLVSRDGRDELLRVRRGETSVAFTTTAALLASVHVSPDGGAALVASTAESGGDVWRVELDAVAPPRLLTAELPPLDVVPESLRAGTDAGWFQAGGELFHAPAGEPAGALDLGALAGEVPDGEPVLGEGGAHLLVALEQDPLARRLVLVDAAGAVTVLTPTPGAWSRAGLADPLGPFLALAADGSAVAWREEGETHELHVSTSPGAGSMHLTSDPDFPEYIDNIGVLGFFDPATLLYLAGDVSLSPVDDDDAIGAADMYAASVDADGSLVSHNVTRTSGQTWPPFTAVGQLVVEHLHVDPLRERAVFDGLGPDDVDQLACFALDGVLYGHGPNLQVLVEDFDEGLEVSGVDRHVLVLAGPPEGLEEAGPGAHVLQPFAPGDQIFDLVAEFPDDTHLDRVAASGAFAAFVAADDDTGAGVPWRVDLLAAEAVPLLSSAARLSPALALTGRGDVVTGLEVEEGLSIFVRIGAPGQVVPLELPGGGGFPLPD